MESFSRTLHWCSRQRLTLLCAASFFCVAIAGSCAQTASVTLHVNFNPAAGKSRTTDAPPGVVAWLTPLSGKTNAASAGENRIFRMVQKNKRFDPHLLVVPIGSLVLFPNHDPFFHNVFSLYNGKRFDLGLYETGSERGVRFDREGVSYIFCNIHPEMGAVILALSTPYYSISADGAFSISSVPPGRYMLNVWSEGATQESMAAARQQVTVGPDRTSLGEVSLVATPSPLAHHANKFGSPYPSSRDPGSTGAKY